MQISDDRTVIPDPECHLALDSELHTLASHSRADPFWPALEVGHVSDKCICKDYMSNKCNCTFCSKGPHFIQPERVMQCQFEAKGECKAADCIWHHGKTQDQQKCAEFDTFGYCSQRNCPKAHHVRRACPRYLAGFCPLGPDCPDAHPRFMNVMLCDRCMGWHVAGERCPEINCDPYMERMSHIIPVKHDTE